MKSMLLKTLLIVCAVSVNTAFAAEAAAPAVDFKTAFAEANKVYKANKWLEAAKQLEAIRPAAKGAWDKYTVDVRLANCYYNSKQYEKSIAAANEALKYPKISVREKNTYVNRIIESLHRLKRFDEALAVADKQLAEPARIDLDYFQTIMNKGIVLNAQGKYAQAVETLKKAEAYKGKAPAFHIKRDWYIAASSLAAGDKAAAKAYFEKVAAVGGKGWFVKDAKQKLEKLSK